MEYPPNDFVTELMTGEREIEEPKDADDIIEAQKEERVYRDWVREQKNTILSMSNPQRKQAAWNKLFPPFHSDDSWMLSAEVF